MGTARITNASARDALELADLRASAREIETDGFMSPDGYTEADVDQMLEEVDRELAAQERAEWVRVSRSFTDQIRAQRAKRRAARVALRALPVRLDASAHESESEAA